MIVCMLVIAGASLQLSAETISNLRVVYWGEAVALIAFGIAWFVSGKALPLIADKEERLKLL
jgi:NADH:ubiquinone oxidoreductase subunit 6 (subunit J)